MFGELAFATMQKILDIDSASITKSRAKANKNHQNDVSH